jgi:VCBS repeat-containing protein
VFTDPAGRPLSYSAPATSAGGGDCDVSIDPSTGVYQHTPTRAQRLTAVAGTTDTFTITVSNGVYTATETVTAAAAPV